MSTHHQARRCGYALALSLLVSVLGIASARADNADDPPTEAAQPGRQPGRPDDSRVREPGTLVDLQRRLDAITAAGTSECLPAYAAHKAQAWLNFGRYAAAEQLPAAAQAALMKNAGGIVESLEQHGESTPDTPELPGARHVRDDLWQAIAAVKRDSRFCAAPKMTAYCEVQLAWAGYEAGAGGWRHADPYVRIAEDYCSTAIATQPAAPAVVPEQTLTVEPAAPVAAPPPTPTPTPRTHLSMSVVFPHNRATRADIRPPGRAELKRLSSRIKALPKDATIMIVGHADLTGRPDYNRRLSEQRARSVKRELEMLGVQPARIRLAAEGSSEPLVQCAVDEKVAERRRYLACLEPNRRVVIHLITEVR
jgi:outer membrane protein OmpA-like peptidoglycan-associated protein